MKKLIKKICNKLTRTFEMDKIAAKLAAEKDISKKDSKIELKKIS